MFTFALKRGVFCASSYCVVPKPQNWTPKIIGDSHIISMWVGRAGAIWVLPGLPSFLGGFSSFSGGFPSFSGGSPHLLGSLIRARFGGATDGLLLPDAGGS